MGLAASQARFLGITARKSNIEYEGQQVNQQRTALAEEVNSLYNKLLSLDVPVAPDATKYYETNYSFSLTNTSGYDGDYLIKNYYQNDDGSYYMNVERSYKKNVAVGTLLANATINSEDVESGKKYTLNTTEGSFELHSNAQNSSSMIQLINNTYGEGTITDDELYYYQDSQGVTHYIAKSVVESYSKEEPIDINSYITDNKDVTENIILQSATVELDANGRFAKISAKDPNTGLTLFNSAEIDTSRVYDQEGYDAALRDYTMSKEEYDKMIADLNAQTDSLQQEDKVLELRLNQIDTEQQALQTELEAVKKVLDDNIEATFKTFS